MTKKQGMQMLDQCLKDLEKCYATLNDLYEQVSHPVSPEVRAKADIILKHGLDVSMIALNFKEIPQEAKKPFAAFLYSAADALQEDGGLL